MIKIKKYNDNPVTNLDPRLPPIFSNDLRLVTVHEGLVHPPITFRLWLGILSSRAFPEFGNLPRIHDVSIFGDDFPYHPSGLQKWNGAAETLNKNPTAINNKLMCI